MILLKKDRRDDFATKEAWIVLFKNHFTSYLNLAMFEGTSIKENLLRLSEIK